MWAKFRPPCLFAMPLRPYCNEGLSTQHQVLLVQLMYANTTTNSSCALKQSCSLWAAGECRALRMAGDQLGSAGQRALGQPLTDICCPCTSSGRLQEPRSPKFTGGGSNLQGSNCGRPVGLQARPDHRRAGWALGEVRVARLGAGSPSEQQAASSQAGRQSSNAPCPRLATCYHVPGALSV